MTPLVSVILPTFNRAALLAEAIASVRAQTLDAWELIVADDGSTDDTAAVLAAITDRRVQIVRGVHVGNPAAVRNAALKVARGRYVAFLDDDDLWLPRKLELQCARLQESGCGWSYTAAQYLSGNGAVRWQTPAARIHNGRIVRTLLSLETAVAGTTVMVDRALLEAVGGFDERFPRGHDFPLWLALAERSPVVALADALTQVRDPSDRTHRDLVAPHYIAHLKRWKAASSDPAVRAACRRGIVAVAAGKAYHDVAAGRWPGAVSTLLAAFTAAPAETTARISGAILRRLRA